MKPSIGRIVHFIGPDGVSWAAIVVGLNEPEEVLNLKVFPNKENPAVVFFAVVPRRSYDGETLCWDWPPRVE